jgi:hypothetical protein
MFALSHSVLRRAVIIILFKHKSSPFTTGIPMAPPFKGPILAYLIANPISSCASHNSSACYYVSNHTLSFFPNSQILFSHFLNEAYIEHIYIYIYIYVMLTTHTYIHTYTCTHVVLEIGSRASFKVGQCSTMELHPYLMYTLI